VATIRESDLPPIEDDGKASQGQEGPGEREKEPVVEAPPLEASPFVGTGIPELEGKTAAEAAALYGQLKQTATGLLSVVQQGRQPAPAPPPEPEPVKFTGEDFEEGKEEQLQEKMGRYFETKAAPFVEEQYRNLATLQYQTAMKDPIIAQYPEEARQMFSQRSVRDVANPATTQQISDQLRRIHHAELVAAEMAKKEKPKVPHQERVSGQTEDDMPQMTALEKEIWVGLGADPKRALAIKKQMQGR